MSKDQVKELSDAGNVIGSHTWDHHNVKKYAGNDWVTQIEKPSKQLETITGKRLIISRIHLDCWNKEAIPELQKRGFKAAFNCMQNGIRTIRFYHTAYHCPRVHGGRCNWTKRLRIAFE